MKFFKFFLIFIIGIALIKLNAQPVKWHNPKNIIIMIGDGMGYNHLKATEYYMYGVSDSCILRKNAFVKMAQVTYPAIVDNKADRIYASGYNVEMILKNPMTLSSGFTDSGAAATALATGKKTYNGAIGIGVENDTLINLVELTKSIDKSAGLVTTVPVSHATPAGFATHNCSRKNYEEIARQIILNSRLDVLMGCGNPDYNKNGELQKMSAKFVGGDEMWQQLKANKTQVNFSIRDTTYTVKDIDKDDKPDAWFLIQDSSDFAKLTTGKTPKRILGIPKVYETLQQERSFIDTNNRGPYKTPFLNNLPSLSLMTAGALNCLNKNKDGFFLMVEGGAIDWASHDNQSDRMIEEVKGFIDAVESVVDWVNRNSNWDETLLIVTADHESGFLWGKESNEKYVPIENRGIGNIPQMKWYSDDHTNSLVPFFAKGAGSNLFNLFADEYDPIYGPYIQNSEIAQVVFVLWGSAIDN